MNIGKSFEKLIDSTFERVDTRSGSILVEKSINKSTGIDGYLWHGEWFETVDQVKDAMKGIFTTISLSIVNKDGEEKQLGKEYTDLYFNGQSAFDAYNKQKEYQK